MPLPLFENVITLKQEKFPEESSDHTNFLTFLQKSMLLDCETHIESLLENVFENYKSLDENSPTGLADLFGSTKESVAPALAPAVRVYSLLHDILSQDAQTMLKNYLQVR